MLKIRCNTKKTSEGDQIRAGLGNEHQEEGRSSKLDHGWLHRERRLEPGEC